jgi:hypothetical protein
LVKYLEGMETIKIMDMKGRKGSVCLASGLIRNNGNRTRSNNPATPY